MVPTKISASIFSPVTPEYITSLPEDLNPFSSSEPRSDSSPSPWNGVPSTRSPRNEPTFPPSISNTWPTVIRDGSACGLRIRSGTTPSSVNGISSCGARWPTTPFCPCREANLSPNSGMRWSRTDTFDSFEPSSPSIRVTVSTTPDSPDRIVTLVSRRFCGDSPPMSSGSSRNRGGEVFPNNTEFSSTFVSGLTSPSSSRWVYASSPRAPRTS